MPKKPSDIPEVMAVMLRGAKEKPGGGWLFCIGGHEFETDQPARCRCPLCAAETQRQTREEDEKNRRLERGGWKAALLDEWEYERRERARVGPLECAHQALLAFVEASEVWDAETARVELVKLLFLQEAEVFSIIANMIAPEGRSYWKLELKRRHGRNREISTLEERQIARIYGWVVGGLKTKNHASPDKTAVGLLAKEFKMTDEKMRAIIKRGQGKKGRNPDERWTREARELVASGLEEDREVGRLMLAIIKHGPKK